DILARAGDVVEPFHVARKQRLEQHPTVLAQTLIRRRLSARRALDIGADISVVGDDLLPARTGLAAARAELLDDTRACVLGIEHCIDVRSGLQHGEMKTVAEDARRR